MSPLEPGFTFSDRSTPGTMAVTPNQLTDQLVVPTPPFQIQVAL